MGLTWASYYQLARVNNAGPETKNYAVTDTNWQTASLLLKRFEQHHHTAATPFRYPGFQLLTPATPSTPLLTLSPTGGSIAAGVTIGVRLSLVDQYGLESEASPETFIQSPAVTLRPNAPIIGAPISTPVPGGLPGGTYVYALTKRMGSGESMLSNVSTVNIPFNTTLNSSYVVPLQFDAINSYVDGTDSLCLYRTTGFDSNFILMAAITATPGRQNALTTFTDSGTVADVSQQPPQTSEFGKQNLLTIDWTTLSIPGSAYRFRVYLTQQAGVWGTQNLFQDYLLFNPSTPFPNNVQYQGIETLLTGFPFDYSQLPFQPPQINLGTEAIGAPIYTTTADADGYQTFNFVFPIGITNSTPLFGSAYIDASIGGNGQLKLCLSTPTGPNNPGLFTTLAGVGSGYAHPLVESGGHSANTIQAAAQTGGPTQNQLNSIFSTPVAGGVARYRQQATNIYKVTATPGTLQNSTSGIWQNIPDMDTISQWPTGIQPDFSGQWFEIVFNTQSQLNWGPGASQFLSSQLLINGAAIIEASKNYGSNTATGQLNGDLSFTFATPLTRSNNRFQVQWMLSFPGFGLLQGTNIPGGPAQHAFYIKELF